MRRSIHFILAAIVTIIVIACSSAPVTKPSPQKVKKKYNNIIITPLPVVANGELDSKALVIESSVVSEEVIAPLNDKQKAELLKIVAHFKESHNFSAIEKDWKKFVKDLYKSKIPIDINAIIQWVFKVSYLDQQDDLRFYSQRVKHYNSIKKEIRALQESILFRIKYCIKSDTVKCPESIKDLAAEIALWDEKMKEMGDDMQLANIDMQNLLQKQQQTVQMLSAIAKVLHDTAIGVIRKMQ